MIAAVLTLAMAAPPDVARAERLYQQARYEDALAALGTSCNDAPNAVECERVRAFTYVALGQDSEARAAFGRMLELDSSATIGDDVSPKLRAAFDAAKSAKTALEDVAIEPVVLVSEREPWDLTIKTPAEAPILSVAAYIAPAGSDAFQPVTLYKKGGGWAGTFRPPSGGLGTARYFLELTLESGATVSAGSSARPQQVEVTLAGAAPDSEGPTQGGGHSGGFWNKVRSLPPWALWSIAGGVAAVAIGGVATAVILSQRKDPGTVVVNISFGDGS